MESQSSDPTGDTADTPPVVESFITRWRGAGGAERANHQPFVLELCDALGVARPEPAEADDSRNDYVFERRVAFHHHTGTTTTGWIDCYKRDCFILEAKQSAKRAPKDGAAGTGPDLFGTPARRAGATGARAWDTVMRKARAQAESYARALPVEHGYPPFLVIVDVAGTIELYADFSGQGKNYAHFPDKRRHRIDLADLRDPGVRDRLARVWTDPHSLDPTRHAAAITRDVADRLARVAEHLENAGHDPHAVADFLMRCLFTMYAEDVGLLPDDAFTRLLDQQRETPETFPEALRQFWEVMNTGGYALHLHATLKQFNGELFKDVTALALDREQIGELKVAAERDWSDVEPAIFGTLLERALDPRERSRLGAHYTPRAYVERLINPTVIEPLRADWTQVQARAHELHAAGDAATARETLRAFLHRLATTRVLDPACGTGNFLYVAMEQMKRLEGEVLDALEALGDDAPRFAYHGETVTPRQFLGLEVNPRAVAIAELVLWIGYLKWQLKTGGPDAVTEPVLHRYRTVREADALITWTRRDLRRDEHGKPITVWDGRTYTDHPVTGERVPDDTARVETYRYTGPKPAAWPAAEFVVGNPPFVAGKDLRAELGDGYAEALWAARPHVPRSADLVMHFWDAAATELRAKDTPVRRFGFITTNSITQTFSRRVLETHLNAKDPVSLVFAVPDHPWLKQSGKAAVRIAMTVAEAGTREGTLGTVTREAGLNTDTPDVEIKKTRGKIWPNIKIGPDVVNTQNFIANQGIAIKGFELGTQSLLIDFKTEETLISRDPNCSSYIKPYMNGNDLKDGRVWRKVIDTYPSDWTDLFQCPTIQNYLLQHVKADRNPNSDSHVLRKWWQFRRTGEAIRDATKGIEHFLVTVRTARFRYFIAKEGNLIPESKNVVIASDDWGILAILSSRAHILFANEKGGYVGAGNDPTYQHTETFDPFPFPDLDDLDASLCDELRELGERLDAFRKARLDEHRQLTMTKLYNVLEKVRALEHDPDAEPLTAAERDVHEAGLVSTLKAIHDDIDRTVLRAYGWTDLIEPLVGKPGATAPSPHATAEQEAAEQTLLARLVQLNRDRAAEENRGHVRWLRPDFQIPRLGHKVPEPAEAETATAELAQPAETARSWPGDGAEQIRVVHDLLRETGAPLDPDSVARAFAKRLTRKRRERVRAVLDTLVATGAAQTPPDEPETYFVP